jgi:hypothetical protein
MIRSDRSAPVPTWRFLGSMLVAVGLMLALAPWSPLRAALLADTIVVRAGEDLQAAIERAQPGDTILLDAGASFVGNFVLPYKPGNSYITIRSSTPDDRLPRHDQRVFPIDAPLLAQLRSPNGLPVIRTAPSAHHWRLMFLEIGPTTTPVSDLVLFGDGSSQQSTLENVAHDLEIDRCYLHGDVNVGQKRGVALNSGTARIANSYFSDFKLVGQDSQAIAGWNGPGPYIIENNYLEAAGENLLFGGADPAVRDLIPSDIRVRHNHFSKPVAWRRERWQVKNLFELKNARRVVIEHNLLEHNWQAAQSGFAILLTPINQDGRAPWSVVADVAFRGNVVRHVAAGIILVGRDTTNRSGRAEGIDIDHNLFIEVNGSVWGGNGAFLQITDAPRDVRVDHNTVMQSGNVISVYGPPTESFVFRNNVVRHNAFGIIGERGIGLETIKAAFPDGVVINNAFAGGRASQYPAGNLFPSDALWVTQFRDYFGGDYMLTPASVFRNAATDGTDLGVDPEMIAPAWAAPSGRR